MTQAVLAALILCVVLGGALFWLGLRGRRLDSRPVCRDCRFDLSSILAATPPGVTCPECGAGLKRPKAFRVGQRGRRPVMTIVGAVLLLTGLVPSVVLAAAMLASADLHRQKPVWILTFELRRSTDPVNSKRIADELMTRMLASSLSTAETADVIAAVLEVQGDTTRPWDEALGDLIERTRLSGTISPADEQKFFDQAAVFVLRVRPSARVSQLLPVSLELAEQRIGSNSYIYAQADLHKVFLNGRQLERVMVNVVDSLPSGPPFSRSTFDFPETAFELMGSRSNTRTTFVDGVHRWYALTDADVSTEASITAEVRVVVGLAATIGSLPITSPDWAQGAAARTISARARVLSVQEPSPSPTAEPQDTTALLQSKLLLRVVRQPNRGLMGGGTGRGGGTTVTIEFAGRAWPRDLCFDVFIKCKGMQPFLLGQFLARADGLDRGVSANAQPRATDMHTVSRTIRTFDFTTCDVILKPRPDVAALTTDLLDLYTGELVWKDVTITR